jgi:hypothetical protein
MSGGKSLALFEVEVAEVGTCLTLWARVLGEFGLQHQNGIKDVAVIQ